MNPEFLLVIALLFIIVALPKALHALGMIVAVIFVIALAVIIIVLILNVAIAVGKKIKKFFSPTQKENGGQT